MADKTGMNVGVTKEDRRLLNWLQRETGLQRRALLMLLVRTEVAQRGGSVTEIMDDLSLDQD